MASNLFIGESISTIYGFEIEGIRQLEDKENGTIMEGFTRDDKLKDQNGDGDYRSRRSGDTGTLRTGLLHGLQMSFRIKTLTCVSLST